VSDFLLLFSRHWIQVDKEDVISGWAEPWCSGVETGEAELSRVEVGW